MPLYEIKVPDGRKVQIRADDPQMAEQRARQWYAEQRAQPPKPKPEQPASPQRQVSTGEDVVRSYAAGALRGLEDLAEAVPNSPANLLSGLRRIPGAENFPRPTNVLGLVIEAAGGENPFKYKPETQAGRYAEKAGEFSPGVVTGGSGAGRTLLQKGGRALAQVALPTIGSEGSRQAAEFLGGDERAQAVAETVGGVLGGGVAATGARRRPVVQQRQSTVPAPQGQTPVAPVVEQAAARVGADFASRADEARAVASEFDVPITRGQQTGDFDQIAFEQAAARNARGQQAGETLRGAFQEQRQAVGRAGEGLAPQVVTPYEAAAGVRSGVRQAAAEAKAVRDAAYKAAETGDAAVMAGSAKELPGKLDAALEAQFFSPDVMRSLNPRTSAIYGEIKGFAGKAGDDLAELPLPRVERVRQAINSASRSAQGADRDALGIMRREFDTWLDDVVDQKLLLGDEKAIAQLKEARRLHRDYRKTYGGGQGKQSEADRMMQKLIADETTDTDAANLLFGRSQISGAGGPVEVVKRLKGVTGEQGPTWDALRSGSVSRLMKRFEPNATGSDYKAMANDFTEALDGSGAPMMRELFSREELGRMRRFRDLLVQLSPPEGAVNRSASGYEVVRAIRQTIGSLGSLTPVVNKMLSSYENAVTAGKARRAVEPTRLSLREALTPDMQRAAAIAGVPAATALRGYERDQRETEPQ